MSEQIEQVKVTEKDARMCESQVLLSLGDAQDEVKRARMELIEVKQWEAVKNVAKYPEHADMIIGNLVTAVVNILR